MDAKFIPWVSTLLFVSLFSGAGLSGAAEPVNPDNFRRAESDINFKKKVDEGMFGKFGHVREPAPIDKQLVVRINRDTLFSWGVFDLTEPVTIIKPDTGKRFQSMVVINEDHYIKQVAYGPGEFVLSREKIGTRYVQVAFRTFVDPANPEDVKEANAIQDKIIAKQSGPGRFEIPDWDEVSLKKVRNGLLLMGSTLKDSKRMFGDIGDVDPVRHMIGTAGGFGGNSESDAVYLNVFPEKGDGKTAYVLKVKDVPVDGFWSVSVYNADGFFEKNDANAYSFNNITAKKDNDGSVTIHFGGDPKQSNYLPIQKGWNYTVRLYRPRKEVIDGSWKFPGAQIVNAELRGEMSDADLTNLVKRSYQYVAMYNTLSGFALNEKNPYSTHGWNKTYKPSGLTDHTVTAIAGPNNDTLYVISALDLRKEPVIVSYPAFDSKFVSLETSAYDHYCDIPLSTIKGDFRKAARVLFYTTRTEGYMGEAIPGVDKIVEMSGDFATAFLRVMPHANDPKLFASNMKAIQDVKVQTLSEFQGREAKKIDPVEFPAYGTDTKVFTGNFVEVMQFVVNHTTFDPKNEMDREVLAAFQPLGVEPGKKYDPKCVVQLDKARIEKVVKKVADEGKANANKVALEKFRPKGEMRLDAMVSQSVTGPVGQPADQAIYLQVDTADGKPMNAESNYILRMSKDQLPPALAFWSVTLYDGEKYLFIPNDEKKYSVGENAGMKLDTAGGIEIHIAAKKPDGVPAENWLPINRKDQALNVRIRVYAPDLEKMKAWQTPRAEKHPKP